jgi:hypothetical protein
MQPAPGVGPIPVDELLTDGVEEPPLQGALLRWSIILQADR